MNDNDVSILRNLPDPSFVAAVPQAVVGEVPDRSSDPSRESVSVAANKSEAT